ncbi:MAG: transporter ATP-binding protein, partial [Enterovirga sp.]|nr:transporter ATP-binding protein [Enterovirga sp.]
EPSVELKGIRTLFKAQPAVEGIDLSDSQAEYLTLLGPSGCGKTTTLNMIAGFLHPDAGTIRLAGRPVEDEPPFRRDIGLVFQDYALFPHMSVAQNVAFGLRMRKVDKREIERRVAEALGLVQLGHLGERRPLQLSGGQRQRVALARALVIRPTVLLLDEPLSNLDMKLREEMRLEITKLQRLLGITTILVTHDQGEALAVSDRIAVLNKGRIEQIGRPVEIYEEPSSRFVAEFIGSMNFLSGTAAEAVAPGSVCRVDLPGGALSAVALHGTQQGKTVSVSVRPEHLRLAGAGPGVAGELAVSGTVTQHVYLGETTQVFVATPSGETCLLAVSKREADRSFPQGATVRLAADAEHCRIF